MTIHADGGVRARVDAVLKRRPVRIAYIFEPAAATDGTPAIRTSLASVPVRLSLVGTWSEAVLVRLTEHFLHHPRLETPIQPFVDLARAIAEGGKRDLWATDNETLGRDYFIDSERRVTLSERWARAGRFFGTIRDDPASFPASTLWREIAGRRRKLFSTLGGCATCPHFRWCGGFLRAIDDRDEACRTWRTAMQMLVDAWRRWRPEVGADVSS